MLGCLPLRTRLTLGVGLGAVLALSGCSRSAPEVDATGDGARSAASLEGVSVLADDEPDVDRSGLQEALDEVAAGFLTADPEAIRPWLYDLSNPFARRWLDRARNLDGVPLAAYHLELDDSLGELATSAVRRRYDDPVTVAYVVEEHVLEGFDPPDRPASEDLFLTAVHTPNGWRFAADTDAEPLGLLSVDHLWDHGPVETTRRGSILALHHPDTRNLDEVLDEANAALGQARKRWPLAWAERVPVLVPRDQDELGQLLHVTFDLSNFVAFATATPAGERGEYELSGSRIMLNPDRFLDRAPSTRQLILVHELLHVATHRVGGPFVPSWLDEGVAQVLGEERSTTGTRLLDALMADPGWDGALPTDGQFTVGGRDRIFLSYQQAWSFVSYLTRTYGRDEVARFYAAAGEGAIGTAGTEAWHVDHAAREVFGKDLAALRVEWRDAA